MSRLGFGTNVLPRDGVLLRSGLQAVDAIDYPPDDAILENQGSFYDRVTIHILGATWVVSEAAFLLTFTPWRRSSGGIWVKGASFTVGANAKETATLTEVDPPTFAADSLTDNGQASFADVLPGDDEPARMIIAVEPADFTSAARFAWAALGSIPPAVTVHNTHLVQVDVAGNPTNVGWIGGGVPDAGLEHYSARRPNINHSRDFPNLAGADFALTLTTVAGVTDGSFFAEVVAVLS